MSETELMTLASTNLTNFKDPAVSMVLSILPEGPFYKGNPGLGVLKFINGGGLGV